MLYLGIDVHKNCSYVTAMTKEGQVRFRGRLSNTKEDFSKMIEKLGEECEAVIETSYCWCVVYDILEEIGVKVKLGDSFKMRAIAECQIKNDVRDSEMLAHLLRSNLVPEVYVPPKEIRQKKNILRERQFLVKVRTAIKNRIHQLLDRNHIIINDCTDIFGASGIRQIKNLVLPDPDNKILNKQIEMLEIVNKNIKETEKISLIETKNNKYIKLLMTMPGIGEVLSKVIALEIVNINRFADEKKFTAYAGLVASEYASNNKIYRGPIVKRANKHLKTALVEGAWSAIKSSQYFRAIYDNVKSRRGTNKAIIAVARHMAIIIYKMLTQNRGYEGKNVYKKK